MVMSEIDEIASRLATIRMNGGEITDKEMDQLASSMQKKMNMASIEFDVYREMAQVMLEKVSLSKRPSAEDTSFGTAPTWSQESSSPEPQQRAETEEAPSETKNNRARSPHRTRPVNIPRSSRSKSPNNASYYSSFPSRSRSPHRGGEVKPESKVGSSSASSSHLDDRINGGAPRAYDSAAATSMFSEGRPPLTAVNIGVNSSSSGSPDTKRPIDGLDAFGGDEKMFEGFAKFRINGGGESEKLNHSTEDAKLSGSFSKLDVNDSRTVKFHPGVAPKSASPRTRGSPSTRRQRATKRRSPRTKNNTPRPTMTFATDALDHDGKVDVTISPASISSTGQAFPDTPAGPSSTNTTNRSERRTSTPFYIRSNIPDNTPSPANAPPFEVHLGKGANFASPIAGWNAGQPVDNVTNEVPNRAAAFVNESTPKTPHEFSADTGNGLATAETAAKKKGRNTTTPVIQNDTTIQFNIGASDPKSTVKNRGGFGSFRQGTRYQTYQSNAVADGVSPAPSTTSMEVDGNTPQQTKPEIPPVDVKFNIGVSGTQKSPVGKGRFRRRDRQGRNGRHQAGRSHRAPSSSNFSSEPMNTGKMATATAVAQIEYEEKKFEISDLREKGKSHYGLKNYRESILKYTAAIKVYVSHCMVEPTKDLLAVLYSNRAAGLLMVGAYQPAADDCLKAIDYVSNPLVANQAIEGGPALRPKLYNRMGRALMKLGKTQSAEQAFSTAITSANAAKMQLSSVDHPARAQLDQIEQEATLGLVETSALQENMTKLSRILQSTSPRYISADGILQKQREGLGLVNAALETATGCNKLHEQKVSLLAKLHRWREVASHCERLAASNVKLDGCFVDDLSSKHPFPGVSPVKYLDVDFFGGQLQEKDLSNAGLKLSSKSVADAVLRLPTCLTRHYVRSLRLEERYPAAESAIRSLEGLMRAAYDQFGLRSTFSWLPQEQGRLARTRIEREKADDLFRRGDFNEASAKYAHCLRIDSDGSVDEDASNSGGRLHAVLHCNRAACLMALKKYDEALTECTAALRIHPRYMKALLRRARCYSRLDRLDESIAEFKRWMDFAQQSKMEPESLNILISPCIFDGPHETKDEDFAQVKIELDEVSRMKAKNEAAARAEAHYRQQRQRWQNERFNQGGDTRSRRDYFYSQQSSSSRRWGTFDENRSGNDRHNPSSNDASRTDGAGHGSSGPMSPRSLKGEKNHYKVLGLPSGANDGEIKKAYKKLALKYHPDKNKNNDAVETFRRVKEAYEVLSDATTRRKYDLENRWRR